MRFPIQLPHLSNTSTMPHYQPPARENAMEPKEISEAIDPHGIPTRHLMFPHDAFYSPPIGWYPAYPQLPQLPSQVVVNNHTVGPNSPSPRNPGFAHPGPSPHVYPVVPHYAFVSQQQSTGPPPSNHEMPHSYPSEFPMPPQFYPIPSGCPPNMAIPTLYAQNPVPQFALPFPPPPEYPLMAPHLAPINDRPRITPILDSPVKKRLKPKEDHQRVARRERQGPAKSRKQAAIDRKQTALPLELKSAEMNPGSKSALQKVSRKESPPKESSSDKVVQIRQAMKPWTATDTRQLKRAPNEPNKDEPTKVKRARIEVKRTLALQCHKIQDHEKDQEKLVVKQAAVEPGRPPKVDAVILASRKAAPKQLESRTTEQRQQETSMLSQSNTAQRELTVRTEHRQLQIGPNDTRREKLIRKELAQKGTVRERIVRKAASQLVVAPERLVQDEPLKKETQQSLKGPIQKLVTEGHPSSESYSIQLQPIPSRMTTPVKRRGRPRRTQVTNKTDSSDTAPSSISRNLSETPGTTRPSSVEPMDAKSTDVYPPQPCAISTEAQFQYSTLENSGPSSLLEQLLTVNEKYLYRERPRHPTLLPEWTDRSTDFYGRSIPRVYFNLQKALGTSCTMNSQLKLDPLEHEPRAEKVAEPKCQSISSNSELTEKAGTASSPIPARPSHNDQAGDALVARQEFANMDSGDSELQPPLNESETLFLRGNSEAQLMVAKLDAAEASARPIAVVLCRK